MAGDGGQEPLGRAGPRLPGEGGAEEAGGHGCAHSRLPGAGLPGDACLPSLEVFPEGGMFVYEGLSGGGEMLRNRQGLGSRLHLHKGVTQRG